MRTGGGATAGPPGPAVSARRAGRRRYLVLSAFGAAAMSGAISLGAPAEVVLWTAAGFTGVLLATGVLIGLDAFRPTKQANSTSHRTPAK
ncbi:hypothetical protein [Actinomadura monticuli]|uniref:Uncharacterized protein n=1 Tax=Actinomadura monticuli TaxID=3097367 RepID=A0ABV4QIJ0_9ACTN